MDDKQPKTAALDWAAGALCKHDDMTRRLLGELWDRAFEQGRLAGLDELQDRLCVCMK
jgi:hypothetical protein